jgi:hypothetical protein
MRTSSELLRFGKNMPVEAIAARNSWILIRVGQRELKYGAARFV